MIHAIGPAGLGILIVVVGGFLYGAASEHQRRRRGSRCVTTRMTR